MRKRAVLLCLCLVLIAGCNSKPETDEEKLNALAMSFAKDYCAIFNTGDRKAAEHFISLYVRSVSAIPAYIHVSKPRCKRGYVYSSGRF